MLKLMLMAPQVVIFSMFLLRPPAEFTCNVTPPTGTLTVSCIASTPYVQGTADNTASQSGIVPYIIEVDGNQTTSSNTDATGHFQITAATNPALPTALTQLENTNGKATVTLYSETYIGGGPVRRLRTNWHCETWQCKAKQQPSVGTIVPNCTATPANISGFAYNTELTGRL